MEGRGKSCTMNFFDSKVWVGFSIRERESTSWRVCGKSIEEM